MPQLFLFGDSITWGSWDPPGGGWAQRLRSEIDLYQAGNDHFWCPAYILGIPGENAEGVSKRIGAEIKARLDSTEEPVVLIAIGTNDSAVIENGKSYSVVEFKDHLRNGLLTAQQFAKKVGLIGLLPVDDTLLTPVSWNPSISYPLARAREFNAACREVAAQQKVPFLELWDEFENYQQSMLFDGLHPNSEGHAWMHQKVRDFLCSTKMLSQPFTKSTCP
ncbi:MAG: hypothetical protein J0M12_11830 [Deltaproteobacteria bacterium]|nr:hypothetical protein [Deltaproteobacteria bacterium]